MQSKNADDGAYLPTPEEIAIESAKIREMNLLKKRSQNPRTSRNRIGNIRVIEKKAFGHGTLDI